MVKELSKLQSEELSLRSQNKVLAREILNGGGGSSQNLNSLGGRGGVDSNSSTNKCGRYKKKAKETNVSVSAKASVEGKERPAQGKIDSLGSGPQTSINLQIVKKE